MCFYVCSRKLTGRRIRRVSRTGPERLPLSLPQCIGSPSMRRGEHRRRTPGGIEKLHLKRMAWLQAETAQQTRRTASPGGESVSANKAEASVVGKEGFMVSANASTRVASAWRDLLLSGRNLLMRRGSAHNPGVPIEFPVNELPTPRHAIP